METPLQTVSRLIGALEELSREEQHGIEEFAYDRVVAVQERELPLVNKIAELMLSPGVARSLDPETQRRAQHLLDRQKAHFARISEEIKITREKLQNIGGARVRADRLRPAYGKLKSPPNRISFSAEG